MAYHVNERLPVASKPWETNFVNHARFALAALLVASTVAISADARITRTGSPQVAFHASGPAGMRINGTTHDLDVDDRGASIVIRVPLANLTTGIGLRDHHMRDKYLQVGSYPNAELTVPRNAISFPAGNGTSSGNATGSMALHGHSKNVNFHYTLARSGGQLRVAGTTTVNMRDYGIVVPSYLGITVKPDVDVEVQFTASE
jgi:polyisoprenoid-binding protein YceI